VTSFPVVLVGSSYWGGLVDWLRGPVLREGKIAEQDLALFSVTDDPAEAVRTVRGENEEHRRRVEHEAVRTTGEQQRDAADS
jgi:predicted Rossmann-fold nucleotide-binding protein